MQLPGSPRAARERRGTETELYPGSVLDREHPLGGSSTHGFTSDDGTARPRRTPPRPAALRLVAAAFAVTMLGTTLPTPLYVLYQQELRFSTLMITVIYAAYAVGVLAALLLFGRVSDEIGRRRALFRAGRLHAQRGRLPGHAGPP